MRRSTHVDTSFVTLGVVLRHGEKRDERLDRIAQQSADWLGLDYRTSIIDGFCEMG